MTQVGLQTERNTEIVEKTEFEPKKVTIEEMQKMMDDKEEELRGTLQKGDYLLRVPIKITILDGTVKMVDGFPTDLIDPPFHIVK
jgi:hypothetical protein